MPSPTSKIILILSKFQVTLHKYTWNSPCLYVFYHIVGGCLWNCYCQHDDQHSTLYHVDTSSDVDGFCATAEGLTIDSVKCCWRWSLVENATPRVVKIGYLTLNYNQVIEKYICISASVSQNYTHLMCVFLYFDCSNLLPVNRLTVSIKAGFAVSHYHVIMCHLDWKY